MIHYLQPPAEIDWTTPLTPASRHHGDIYWSLDASIDEKRHVFIDGNELRSRFSEIPGCHFTLAEVGFGFGINFLLTAGLWRRIRPKDAVLNYIAIENAPVPIDALRRLYDGMPASQDINASHQQRLLTRYPIASPGMHAIRFDENIYLLLFIGDVRNVLHDIDACVDAWYLDGFSPAKNADAWEDSLYRQMSATSRPGATVATYSVASAVRQGLAAAGFDVKKSAGFGRKAEMLTARHAGAWQPQKLDRPHTAIVGAGLAGLSVATALADRGIRATVFDGTGPLTGASGIPALAVYPHLAVNPNASSLFALSAFDYATDQAGFIRSGRINVAFNDQESERLQRLGHALGPVARFCDIGEVRDATGMTIERPGLHIPGAGWIQAGLQKGFEFDRRQIDESSLMALTREFDQVIIAPGWNRLDALKPLGLTPVRGQAVEAKLPDSRLGISVGGKIAAIPIQDGSRLIAGSTYSQPDTDLSERMEDSIEIAKALEQTLNTTVEISNTYTGIRCATRDRQPVAGALPKWRVVEAAVADTTVHKRAFSMPVDAYESGLWVMTGLGSHGATTAPLLGEYLARLITGEASCLTRGWAAQFDAARFHLRDAGLRHSVTSYRPR